LDEPYPYMVLDARYETASPFPNLNKDKSNQMIINNYISELICNINLRPTELRNFEDSSLSEHVRKKCKFENSHNASAALKPFNF